MGWWGPADSELQGAGWMGDPSLKRNGISFSVSVFNIQSVYRVMVCDGLDQASEVPLGTALFTQATKKSSPQKA